MPVRELPSNPNVALVEDRARELLTAHAAREPQAAQRIREFHRGFHKATDAEIFDAPFGFGDAQSAIAGEHGFASWARLKRRIEKPTPADNLSLPHHERIGDSAFRRAVELLDAGNAADLRTHLQEHPDLVRQRVLFEGGNYFRNPTVLEFVAESPIRHGTLPANIVEVATVILDAGAHRDATALDQTLGLVCSGCVPRKCGVQVALIDLLCDRAPTPTMPCPPRSPMRSSGR